MRDHGLPAVACVLEGILAAEKLDAIVYPTSSRRPALIAAPPDVPGGGVDSGSNLANLSGFPDLIVPAGFTGDDLPVGISFMGPAFSESKLIALGYSFEQATHARRLPVNTPKLAGEVMTAAVAASRCASKIVPRLRRFRALDRQRVPGVGELDIPRVGDGGPTQRARPKAGHRDLCFGAPLFATCRQAWTERTRDRQV